MKRFVFEFNRTFHNSDASVPLVNYFFTLDGPDTLLTDRQFQQEDPFLFFIGDMEEYGVHDFGTSGDEEWIGFGSYEITEDNEVTVVEKWKEYLTGIGFVCGETITLPSDEYIAKFFPTA